jgi:hypothetical protein
VHLAAVAVVEDAVLGVEVVAAAGEREDDPECYRAAVRARRSVIAGCARPRAQVVLVVAIVVATGMVRAEPATDFVARPLVLAAGELDAQLVLETNLRARSVGRPLSLAPDVWLGLTPRWTVGIVHSNRSVDQIASGDSFCLREGGLGCDRIYQGSGLDARWAVLPGVVPRVRLLLRDVAPLKPAVTLGALVRWQRGRFAITSDPYVRLGLANRDRGNRAAVFVPVWFAAQPTCRWVVALHTGFDGELAVLRDGYHVPIGLVVGVRPIAPVEIVAEIGFPSLLGPQNQFADRTLSIGVGWRGRPR